MNKDTQQKEKNRKLEQLEALREKLHTLEMERIRTANAPQIFELDQKIKECQEEIERLEQPPCHYSDYRVDFFIEPPAESDPEQENWPMLIRTSFNLHQFTEHLRLLCFPTEGYKKWRERDPDLSEYVLTWDIANTLDANDLNIFRIEEFAIDGWSLTREQTSHIDGVPRSVEYIYRISDEYLNRTEPVRIDCVVLTRKLVSRREHIKIDYTFYHEVERCELSLLSPRETRFKDVSIDCVGVHTMPDMRQAPPLKTKLLPNLHGHGCRGDRIYFPRRLHKASRIAFHIYR